MTKRALSLVLLAVLLLAACSPPSGSVGTGVTGGAQGTGGTGGTLPTGGSAQSGPPPASTAAAAPSSGGTPLAQGAGAAPSPAAAATAGTAPSAAQAPVASAQAVYAPPQLQDAPANMRDSVILGGSILTDTQKALAGTVGNKLTCSNCHFNGGLTQGGKNGGISLVGVGAKYPTFTSRHGSTDLALRTFD